MKTKFCLHYTRHKGQILYNLSYRMSPGVVKFIEAGAGSWLPGTEAEGVGICYPVGPEFQLGNFFF